jgi:hypothetical protein
MCVRVHEAGHNRAASRVDLFVCAISLTQAARRANLDDQPVINRDRAALD